MRGKLLFEVLARRHFSHLGTAWPLGKNGTQAFPRASRDSAINTCFFFSMSVVLLALASLLFRLSDKSYDEKHKGERQALSQKGTMEKRLMVSGQTSELFSLSYNRM